MARQRLSRPFSDFGKGAAVAGWRAHVSMNQALWMVDDSSTDQKNRQGTAGFFARG